MQTVKEHHSLFVEKWAKAEYINAKLGISIMVLSGVCVILAGALIYTFISPRPIYYIPSMSEAGIAYPKQIPESSVAVFTSSWVLNWTNFTPVTVVNVYERAKRFMSPGLLEKTNQRLAKDLDDVKRNNMSSLFSLKEEPQVEKDGQNYIVSIHGDKGVYMGKETVSTQSMIYRVSLRVVSPTEVNPYGLMIEDIDQEIIRS